MRWTVCKHQTHTSLCSHFNILIWNEPWNIMIMKHPISDSVFRSANRSPVSGCGSRRVQRYNDTCYCAGLAWCSVRKHFGRNGSRTRTDQGHRKSAWFAPVHVILLAIWTLTSHCDEFSQEPIIVCYSLSWSKHAVERAKQKWNHNKFPLPHTARCWSPLNRSQW